MPPIRKPSEKQPVKCQPCRTLGYVSETTVTGGRQFCVDCLGVGYVYPDGEPLPEHEAIKVLKNAENYYKSMSEKLQKQLKSAEEKLKTINNIINPSPDVYREDGRGKVYHGD